MLLVKQSIIYSTDETLECVVLMTLMYLMVRFGYWLKKRQKSEYEHLGALEGSSFGLLGLILAFTFGMASNRYDARRNTIVEEVNNISSALIRVEMFKNDSVRTVLYNQFHKLIDLRIKTNETKVFDAEYDSVRKNSYLAVRELYRTCNNLTDNPKYTAASLQTIPALLKINDSITSRYNVMNASVPEPVFVLLFLFALACSSFAGFSLPVAKKVNWLPVFSFIVFTGFVIYIIMDLDRPKRGFITLKDQYERVTDLLQMLPSENKDGIFIK